MYCIEYGIYGGVITLYVQNTKVSCCVGGWCLSPHSFLPPSLSSPLLIPELMAHYKSFMHKKDYLDLTHTLNPSLSTGFKRRYVLHACTVHEVNVAKCKHSYSNPLKSGILRGYCYHRYYIHVYLKLHLLHTLRMCPSPRLSEVAWETASCPTYKSLVG